MERGTIKWYDEAKGFGFITSETGGQEYFVHVSGVGDMEGTLEKGQRVEFEIGEGKKGPMAINVRSIDESE